MYQGFFSTATNFMHLCLISPSRTIHPFTCIFLNENPFKHAIANDLQRSSLKKNCQVIDKLCSTSFHKEEGHGI
jgi:hypothetical protein